MFVFILWIWCWIMPLSVIIFSYGKITTQVMTHEAKLKEQAKKMNVESLRSGGNKDSRNEIRVAKVGISLTTLFLLSWTPYFAIAFIGCYGNRSLLTPGLSMIPACTCKLAACVDPFVYAINHPKWVVLHSLLNWLFYHFCSNSIDIDWNWWRECLGFVSTKRTTLPNQNVPTFLFLPTLNREHKLIHFGWSSW